MRKNFQFLGIVIIFLNLIIYCCFEFTQKTETNCKTVKLTSKIFGYGNAILEDTEKLPNDKMSICKIILDKRKDQMAIQFLVNNIDQVFFCDDKIHFDCEPTSVQQRLIDIGSDTIPYLSSKLLTSNDKNTKRIILHTLRKMAVTCSQDSAYRKYIINILQKALLAELDTDQKKNIYFILNNLKD